MIYFTLCNSPGTVYEVDPQHVDAFREKVDGYCECSISEKLALALVEKGDGEARWGLCRYSPEGFVHIHPHRDLRHVRPFVPGGERLDADTARARVLSRTPR